MLKRTTRLSLVQQVVAQIEHLIEHEHWKVGDKIPPETALMEQFDVSRNTLREAIRALVHTGLLETKQGSGTIVRSTSALGAILHRHIERSDVFETLEVRLALEREAAQLAAKRRTDEQLEVLEQLLHACIKAVKQDDIQQFVKNDMEFHRMVVKCANNKLLYDLYEHMTEPVSSSIHEILSFSRNFNMNEEVHQDLLDAIKAQDEKLAKTYVGEYIQVFKKRISHLK